jgi:hypothetical protein
MRTGVVDCVVLKDRPEVSVHVNSRMSGFGGLVVSMLASGTFGGLVVSMLASGTQDRPSDFFRAKNSAACLPAEGK